MKYIRKQILLFCVVLLFGCFQLHSQNRSSIEVKNATVRYVLKQIERQFGCDIVYDRKIVKNQPRVSFTASSIDEALSNLRNQTTLNFKRLDLLIAVSGKKNSARVDETGNLENKKINGVVIDDQTGEPLIGATIQVPGMTIGTITNEKGEFEFLFPPNVDFLKVSYVGFLPSMIRVDTQVALNIRMKPDLNALKEFVFIGYGTNDRENITSSISSIKEKDFNKGIVTSPEELIKGKVSGVQITTNTGQPGSPPSFFIRGINSIRNQNSPLYVIDGIPLNVQDQDFSVDSDFGKTPLFNPLNFINTADIQSVEVLKDASAGAIYGTRAANGVIIITTKDGKNKETTVDYSSYYVISKIRKKLNLFNADQYRENVLRIGAGDQIFSETVDTDWQDEIFRTALSTKQQINIGGSNEHTHYYTSISYASQEGIIPSNVLKTYSGRVNITYKVNDGFFKDRLELPLKVNFTHVFNDGNAYSYDFNSNGTFMEDLVQANPTYPVRNPDGTIFDFPIGRNPLVLLEQIDDFSRIDRLVVNASPTLNITSQLEYQINLAADRSTHNREYQIAPSTLNDFGPLDGRVEFIKLENTNLLIENFLTYQYGNANLNLSLLLGSSLQVFKNRSLNNSINDFSTSEIDAFNNPGIGTSLTIDQNAPLGFNRVSELQSYFNRVNISLLDKYLFTGTLRYDGSSRFGENNKFGLFPSIAFGWRLSDEPFLQTLKEKQISLKLRTSWGQTGSQDIPQGITMPFFNVSNGREDTYPIGGSEDVPGFIFTRTSNEDIKWEVTSQSNVGLDFELFNGKIQGTADYFYKSTTDVLLNLINEDPLEVISFWDNSDMQIINEGIELNLVYYANPKPDFSFSIGANATFLENEIRNAPFEFLVTSNSRGLANERIGIHTDGVSANSFFMLDFTGFDANGNSNFRDINDDGVINDEDRIIAGNSIP
ncbi:MAG: SusC/RagA family TonB-linked outer membrane protein, partial [Bacteroidota bacterium]